MRSSNVLALALLADQTEQPSCQTLWVQHEFHEYDQSWVYVNARGHPLITSELLRSVHAR